MKKLIIILMLVSSEAMAWGEGNQYKFDECKNVGQSLYRCENKEAICYRFYIYQAGGLSCKFKQ